jgi:anti-anti-sigma factor
MVCIALAGELDLAVAPELVSCLDQVRTTSSVVRLDLSELSFMDSTGLGTVLTAVLDARREGWQLEIHPGLARPVARIVELAGVAPYLWPDPPV